MPSSSSQDRISGNEPGGERVNSLAVAATHPDGPSERYAPVRRVLWAVLVANLTVTLVKLALGFMTGALSVIADGFHSLVDTSSNLIGLAAVRLASRPADDHHPYGYARYETIGTFAIGGLLLVVAYEVGEAVVNRLIAGGEPDLSPLSFWLVVLTLPVNIAVYLLERQAGRRLKSGIILADAEHTRTDLLVTTSVIVSLIGVRMGWVWLDLVTAVIVAVFIIRAAIEIIRQAAATLTDRIVADPAAVESVARGVPGVELVHRVRSRGAPGSGFVDLHVKVHPGMSTDQAHAIASEVERQLRAQLPEIADALVHIEPAPFQAGMLDRIRFDLRRIADGMGLGMHDLHVHAEEDGVFSVELHLEMPSDITLGAAHDLADEFEARVKEIATRPFRLIAHLEPIPDEVLQTEGNSIPGVIEEEVAAVIRQHLGKQGRLRDLRLYRLGPRLGVAVVLTADASISLSDAHALSELIERVLLTQMPVIHRVTVHVEPEA